MQAHRHQQTALTLPNALSVGRLALVPVLFLLAWNGRPRAFLVCLVASLTSDFLDGLLARMLNQSTELGAKLNTWADLVTTLSLPACAWLLSPELIQREAIFLIAPLGTYLASLLFGLIKYRRLTSYHTWAGKVAAFLLGGTGLVLLAGGPAWPFECATPAFVVAGLEEMAITTLLPEWRANVPSFRHAFKLSRESRSGRRD